MGSLEKFNDSSLCLFGLNPDALIKINSFNFAGGWRSWIVSDRLRHAIWNDIFNNNAAFCENVTTILKPIHSVNAYKLISWHGHGSSAVSDSRVIASLDLESSANLINFFANSHRDFNGACGVDFLEISSCFSADYHEFISKCLSNANIPSHNMLVVVAGIPDVQFYSRRQWSMGTICGLGSLPYAPFLREMPELIKKASGAYFVRYPGKDSQFELNSSKRLLNNVAAEEHILGKSPFIQKHAELVIETKNFSGEVVFLDDECNVFSALKGDVVHRIAKATIFGSGVKNLLTYFRYNLEGGDYFSPIAHKKIFIFDEVRCLNKSTALECNKFKNVLITVAPVKPLLSIKYYDSQNCGWELSCNSVKDIESSSAKKINQPSPTQSFVPSNLFIQPCKVAGEFARSSDSLIVRPQETESVAVAAILDPRAVQPLPVMSSLSVCQPQFPEKVLPMLNGKEVLIFKFIFGLTYDCGAQFDLAYKSILDGDSIVIMGNLEYVKLSRYSEEITERFTKFDVFGEGAFINVLIPNNILSMYGQNLKMIGLDLTGRKEISCESCPEIAVPKLPCHSDPVIVNCKCSLLANSKLIRKIIDPIRNLKDKNVAFYYIGCQPASFARMCGAVDANQVDAGKTEEPYLNCVNYLFMPNLWMFAGVQSKTDNADDLVRMKWPQNMVVAFSLCVQNYPKLLEFNMHEHSFSGFNKLLLDVSTGHFDSRLLDYWRNAAGLFSCSDIYIKTLGQDVLRKVASLSKYSF